MSESIKIIQLQAENFKRIRAVAFSPNENGLTIIGGDNAQGKTSVLDAICYALGGEKFRPTEIQNDEGMSPASIKVRLSNGLVAERGGKNAALKVTDPQGLRSGQKILDELLEQLALQLPKFMNANAKDKGKTLLRTLGIEDQLDALDTDERKEYDERTIIGREYERKQKAAEEMNEWPDLPPFLIDTNELVAQVEAVAGRNAERSKKRFEIMQSEQAVDFETGKLQGMKSRLEEMKADFEKRIKEQELAITAQEQAVHNAEDKVSTLKSVPIEADESADEIKAKIAEAKEINVKIAENQSKQEKLEEAKLLKKEYEAKTAEIEAIRTRRDTLLNSVKMPLDGLSIEQGELIYNGKHWDCMSSMEQVLVAVSICHAVKPSCGFVLLDRLECFDGKQLNMLAKWLEEHDVQGIATRVSTGEECTLVIEDGLIKKE